MELIEIKRDTDHLLNQYNKNITLNDNKLFRHLFVDLIAGSLGGIGMTLVGHPLDTVKIRMQSNNKTMKTVITECIKHEGPIGLYKGMGFPILSLTFINALVFSSNEFAKKYFGYENEDSLYEGMITGAFAGLVNTIVRTPSELVKCRLQVQSQNLTNSKYKGIGDCLKKIYGTNGLRGLYKGNVATILREVPGYGAQFGLYYYTKSILAKITNTQVKNLNNICLSLAGGISGVLCWFICFPQDVVKTKIQLDVEDKHFNKTKFFFDGGVLSCSRNIYRTEGIPGFFVGFRPQILQAVIGNGVLFMIYENTKSYLSHFELY